MSRSLCCSLLLALASVVLGSQNARAGQFLEGQSYPGGAGTVAMATGDFNGQSIPAEYGVAVGSGGESVST